MPNIKPLQNLDACAILKSTAYIATMSLADYYIFSNLTSSDEAHHHHHHHHHDDEGYAFYNAMILPLINLTAFAIKVGVRTAASVLSQNHPAVMGAAEGVMQYMLHSPASTAWVVTRGLFGVGAAAATNSVFKNQEQRESTLSYKKNM